MHAPVRFGFVARQLFARSHNAPPYDDAFYISLVKQIVGTLRGSRGGGVAEARDENHSGAPYVDFGQHGNHLPLAAENCGSCLGFAILANRKGSNVVITGWLCNPFCFKAIAANFGIQQLRVFGVTCTVRKIETAIKRLDF